MIAARRDPTILFALLVALGAHLVLISVGIKVARRDLGWWLQSQSTPGPTLTPINPPDSMDRLGDHETSGTSINRSLGDVPLESAVADARQEQAAMQRDNFGFGGNQSTARLNQLLRGDNGDNSPRGNAGSQSAATVFGSRESTVADLAPKTPAHTPGKNPPAGNPPAGNPPAGNPTAGNSTGNKPEVDPLAGGPLTPVPLQQAATGPRSDQSSPSPEQPNQPNTDKSANNSSTAGGTGGTPGADPGAGKPIPTSNFESFPITHLASRFVSGRVLPQTGRKNLLRKQPDLGLAANGDLYALDQTSVVMLLKLDTNGNVIDVKIKQSSGSDNIDLASQRAAYTWWFEPLKDPQTGQVHQEDMEFTIYY